jgi:hypothetical protein
VSISRIFPLNRDFFDFTAVGTSLMPKIISQTSFFAGKFP